MNRLVNSVKKGVIAAIGVAVLGVGLITSIQGAKATLPAQFNTRGGSGDYELLQLRKLGQTNWGDPISADPGDTVEFLVYYHNNGDVAATNTKIQALLPTGFGTQLVSVASIDSDQTAKIYDTTVGLNGPIYGTTGGTVNVTGDQAQLQAVPNSQIWYNQDAQGNLVASPFPNGQTLSDLIDPNGTGVNIGTVNGCWKYAGYVYFQAQLVGGTPSATVDKKVQIAGDSNWSSSVTTGPDNYVNWYVFYNNTGTATATGVHVIDTLPNNLTWVSGASKAFWRVKVNNTDTDIPVDESKIAWNGSTFDIPFVNTDVQPVSSDAFFLVFQTKIDDASHFSVGQTTLTNTAKVTSSNGVNATTPAATVIVDRPQDPTIIFNVVKDVANLSIGQGTWNDSAPASPGDELAFRIQVQNTGDTSATGVKVKDALPQYLTYKPGSTQLTYYDPAQGKNVTVNQPDGITTSSGLTVDVPAGNGNERLFTFRAFIDTNAPAGDQTMVNTGIVPAGANGSMVWIQASDTADVLLTSTQDMVLEKTVKTTGSWVESVNAEEGDTVYFRIRVINNGNSNLTGIHVLDVLPNYLTYIPGSFQVDGVADTDGITTVGKDITNLSPGVVKTLTFAAKVVDCPPLGDNQLQNVAQATATGISQITDDAWVSVLVSQPTLPL